MRSCGACSLCCKVMGVTEIEKPRNAWCHFAKPGRGGCSIFGDPQRPASCGEFLCAWVERDAGGLPDNLRPDLVHAFVTGVKTNEVAIVVHVDPGYPNAWREGALSAFIDSVTARGVKVLVAVGNKRFMRLGAQWLGVKEEVDGPAQT